jgi:hypothetical protein
MLTVNNDGGSEACLSLCTHWQQQSINDKSEVHCSQFMLPKSANHYAPFCSSSLRARCGGVRQGLPARWSPCLWRIFCGISYLPRCFSFECRHTDGHSTPSTESVPYSSVIVHMAFIRGPRSSARCCFHAMPDHICLLPVANQVVHHHHHRIRRTFRSFPLFSPPLHKAILPSLLDL